MADFRKAPVKYLHDPSLAHTNTQEMRDLMKAPGIYTIFDETQNTVRIPVTGNGRLHGGVIKGRQVRLVALWGEADDGSPLEVYVRSTGRNYGPEFVGPLPADYPEVDAVSDRPVESHLRLYALSIEQAPPAGETYTLEASTAHVQPGKPKGTSDAAPLTIEVLPQSPTGAGLPAWAGGPRDATRDAIIAECRRQGVSDEAQIAYVLATVEWETAGGWQPIRERQFGGHPPEHSEAQRRTLRYEQDGVRGSSFVYYGRGYVQLTHNANYTNIGRLIGINLAADPDLALRPDIALFSLVRGMQHGMFTGLRLSNRINPSDTRPVHEQFVRARAIVNADGDIINSGATETIGEHIASRADAWLAFLRPPGRGPTSMQRVRQQSPATVPMRP